MLTQLGAMIAPIAQINWMAWMYLGPALMAVHMISSLILWLAYDTVRATAAGKAAMKEAMLMKTAGWTMIMAGLYVNSENWKQSQVYKMSIESGNVKEEIMEDDMFATLF